MDLNDPTVLFDFQVNLMLSHLVMTIQDCMQFPDVQWKSASPETLGGLRVLDKAISNLNKITERRLKESICDAQTGRP